MKHNPNTPPVIQEIRDEIERDLNLPVEKLLENMKRDSLASAYYKNSELRRTLNSFAVLIGRINRTADRQTKLMIVLTALIAILTILLLKYH